MNINGIVNYLKDCPCKREHKTEIEGIECLKGNVHRTGEILERYNFPKSILLVADKNTLKASKGIEESLKSYEYNAKKKIYENFRTADMTNVNEIQALSKNVDGILSVGTGSLNDICRLAAFRENKDFCIFATAPSMDGFASDSAPITENSFKQSFKAKQPRILIADTTILAMSPCELKTAGFGDMIAKLIGLCDWRIAHFLIDEYYCDRVASLTQEAIDRILALAPHIQENNEESAAAVFEALVLTGLCMGFTENSRPASGAEHIISHFWESKKLQQGEISDYHGKKVGVATLICNSIYNRIADVEDIMPVSESIKWEEIMAVYGDGLSDYVLRLNTPTITNEISLDRLRSGWQHIRNIIKDTLPSDDFLAAKMKEAGTAITAKEAGIDDELKILGIKYHSYMRNRLTLMRIIPLLNLKNAQEILGL